MPPNQGMCGSFGSLLSPLLGGVAPASSRHVGGAHVLTADGAVRMVSDSIDAGDPHQSTVYVDLNGDGNLADSSAPPSQAGAMSPFGVWGALGTRASSEVPQLD